MRAEPGGARALGPARYALIDKQGIDLQVLSINGHWWYDADRDLAARIVRAQNEGLAKWVSGNGERFDAFASVALQFPDLAAQQLDDAVKRLRLRGAAIGGHALNEDLSLPKYDVFWAKAAELGVPVLTHPAGAENIIKQDALEGRADLGNIIGNPLETTYLLSRLIFDGTLDKHPGLKVIAVHGGGYLPSYMARTDVACKVRNNANCANTKDPREYFKQQLIADTMVLTDEGLRHLVAEIGRLTDRLRDRQPPQLAGDDRPGAERVVPRQRAEGSDPGRQCAEVAADSARRRPPRPVKPAPRDRIR